MIVRILAQGVPAADPAAASFSLDWNEIALNLTTHALRIVLILGLVYGGLFLLRRLLIRMGMQSPLELAQAPEGVRRRSTILRLTLTFLSIAIWLVAAMTILSLLGINIAPLIAGAGVVGIALGFGAQSLVSDILGGVFILFEEKIRVGDFIRVNDVSGVAESIDLRSITLRDFSGDAHIINWSQIERLTNSTYGWSRVLLDVGVAYDAEPDKVMDVMERTCLEMKADAEWAEYFLEEPQVLGITEFGDSAITYRLIVRVRASYQWSMTRELRRRMWYAFRDNGLEFPFPQVTLSHLPDSPMELKLLNGGQGQLPEPPIEKQGKPMPKRSARTPEAVQEQLEGRNDS